MKVLLEAYFSDPVHREMSHHYEELHERKGWLLIATRDWWQRWMPPVWEWGTNLSPLRATLLDTETSRRYEVPIGAFYEETLYPDGGRQLQEYMYASHFCTCHRKSAANDAGGSFDAECEGSPLVIERIEAANLPGLILYSEMMTLEELEASLCRKPITETV